jgi:hypothetical protein
VPTVGSDSGGNFHIRSDDAAVLTLLRALPDPPGTGSGWSRATRAGQDKSSADSFEVDGLNYRKALASGINPATGALYETFESGKADGTFAHRNPSGKGGQKS